MNFELPDTLPSITKEFLLSKNSEETYMATYLGIPVKKGLVVSPLRNDHKPTASFYRNKKGDLIFHDFGVGFHGNFIGVVMYLNSCTYFKALQIIAEDFGYLPKKSDRIPIKIKHTTEIIQEKADTTIQVEPQPFSISELKWWESFGIDSDTLCKYKVVSCKSVFLNGNYLMSSSPTKPIYGYYCGKTKGKELWRIYMPKSKIYRFISNTHKYFIQGSKQLPSSANLLLITKSQKDVMLAYKLGIPAIAPCSETQFLSEAQITRLKNRFKEIVVMYDNDYAGITNLNKIRKKYPDLKYFWIPRGLEKDLSDYYRAHGYKKTIEGIEKVKKALKIGNWEEK